VLDEVSARFDTEKKCNDQHDRDWCCGDHVKMPSFILRLLK
jgi:hypothetical protein